MKATLHQAVSLALLSVAALSSGCKPPPSMIQFNNRIAEANAKLYAVAGLYRKALITTGGATNEFELATVKVEDLKAAYSKMDETLKEVQSLAEDMDLPRRSTTATGMKEAFDKYLVEQKKVLDKANEITDVVAAGKRNGDNAGTKAKVIQLLGTIKELETAAYADLEKAQKGLADAHFLKLVSKLD